MSTTARVRVEQCRVESEDIGGRWCTAGHGGGGNVSGQAAEAEAKGLAERKARIPTNIPKEVGAMKG